jgi:hypothetical protein
MSRSLKVSFFVNIKLTKNWFVCQTVLCLFLTMYSCDSKEPPAPVIDYISSTEEAKEVLKSVYWFWEYSAKSAMPRQTTIVDQVLTDNFGSVPLSGEITYSSDGESTSTGSWSASSTIIDIHSIFPQGFSYNDIKISGELKFHDIDNYSDVCSECFTCIPSGMQCSGTANISLSIKTVKSLYVEFEYNGKKINDIIAMDGIYQAGTWDMTIKNKKGKEFKVDTIW